MVCKQCKTDKPDDQFLHHGKRGRLRIRFCNTCAAENMARYWRTRMVGKKPEEFASVDD